MFFGLVPIEDHPCCNMQDVVEAFFLNSVQESAFSLGLFPDWIRPTLSNPASTLRTKFSDVHALLHANGVSKKARRAIYEQVRETNCIQELCNGTKQIPKSSLAWDSPLGVAVKLLMETLYSSLDMAVFRRPAGNQTDTPTHQLYSEFVSTNHKVCPFCGLSKFKNRLGARREDFDHYLHKSEYPLAAANMKNLVPTCGTCNQDYKKAKNILGDGAAFYPFAQVPEVKVDIECVQYPSKGDTMDTGKWVAKLELIKPDASTIPKMKAWERVYAIKKRLENEVQDNFEEWMRQVADDHPDPLEKDTFRERIASAKTTATERSKRRMEAGQIIRAAFYDFMLNRAKSAFVESFRWSQNQRCA